MVNKVNNDLIDLEFTELAIDIVYRPNVGMNIGAWDHGWRANEGFANYVFMQDDCYIVKDNWLSSIVDKLNQPDIGLVCESINQHWDLDWDALRLREANTVLPEHFVNGHPANRIDAYLHFLKSHAIDPTDSGVHARALVWALKEDRLLSMNGFPIGANYGECIAAEIAVSLKIRQSGLKIDTVSVTPFDSVRHVEWNQSYPGGEYTQLNARDKEIKALESLNKKLVKQLEDIEELATASVWKQLTSVLSGRFRSQLRHTLKAKS